MMRESLTTTRLRPLARKLAIAVATPDPDRADSKSSKQSGVTGHSRDRIGHDACALSASCAASPKASATPGAGGAPASCGARGPWRAGLLSAFLRCQGASLRLRKTPYSTSPRIADWLPRGSVPPPAKCSRSNCVSSPRYPMRSASGATFFPEHGVEALICARRPLAAYSSPLLDASDPARSGSQAYQSRTR